VTLSCAPTGGTGNCSAVQAGASNTATVVFTIAKATGSSNLRTSTIDFGDGTSQDLGALAGSTTVSKTYAGPSGSTPRTYAAVVRATDINGETTSATTNVTVNPNTRTPISVTIATPTCTDTAGQAETCGFTATVSGGGDGGTGNASIESYTWNFGDDSDEVTTSGNATSHVYTSEGSKTVTVTARTPDGRTATGRIEIFVDF
jgi:hypothetical protein